VQRNATRDKHKHKEVVESIAQYGVQRAQGVSVMYQMQLFDKFKVADGHVMSKWALCKECCTAGNYALAQVSRGSHDPGKRCVSNLRKHVQLHHKSTYENLLLREGTSGPKITDHLVRSTRVTRGSPNQSEEETVDALLQLVTEELDPWSRTQSFAVKKLVRSIHPNAWVPCEDTLRQHAVKKVRYHAPMART
jgi:hypothetical protein